MKLCESNYAISLQCKVQFNCAGSRASEFIFTFCVAWRGSRGKSAVALEKWENAVKSGYEYLLTLPPFIVSV